MLPVASYGNSSYAMLHKCLPCGGCCLSCLLIECTLSSPVQVRSLKRCRYCTVVSAISRYCTVVREISRYCCVSTDWWLVACLFSTINLATT